MSQAAKAFIVHLTHDAVRRPFMTPTRIPLSLFLLLGLLLCAGINAAERPALEIDGVRGRLADNIRLYLESRASPRDWGAEAEVREQTARALKPFGYYDPQIQIRREPERLHLQVTPGPQVLWVEPELKLEGSAGEMRAFQRLLRRHPFQPGTPLSHSDYDDYRERWASLARDYGFFDARMTRHTLRIDPDAREARAILHFESGPRYTIGALHFSGGSLHENVLRVLSPLQPGDGYSRQDLQQLHRALQETGYFGGVQVRSERDENRHQVDLHITVTDAPLDRYSIGAGFGTDTGPRGRLRWERPLVNPKGHRFQSELYVSTPRTELNAQYLIPLSHPLDHFGRISASLKRKDNEDTESRLVDIGYDIHRRLRDDWQFSYGVHLQNERYQQGSEPEQELTYLLPGTRLSQLKIARGVDPGRGHKTWLEVTGSTEHLGADVAFLRVRAGHSRLWSLARRHTLIGRAEVGFISTGDITAVPASQRFFTGGDQSVRGFDYESLSSRDANGELTGGRYLNVASLEYSYRFAEHWRAAVFTDAGRAFNETSEPWHQSVGFGVRWLSPVGQIRGDLAFPIDDDRESGWRIHIYMGPPL